MTTAAFFLSGFALTFAGLAILYGLTSVTQELLEMERLDIEQRERGE